MSGTKKTHKNTGGGKIRLKSGERRERIVVSAERLFSEKGFRGTTTREIALAAGISEAMIFRHFSTKKALYTAIIDRSTTDSSGSFVLSSIAAENKGEKALYAIASYLVRRYAEDPSFAKLLMYSALEGGEFSDIFMKSRGVEILNTLSKELKDLANRGCIRKMDTELAARAFMGMVVHYCMMQEIYGFKKYFKRPHKKVVDTFVDIFLNGVLEDKCA